ncbi:streptococcal hemagglutinin-like [Aricia agestis]|uniref:streptococcal hemagglutinin-like n=1 Tax=Aricia agestis TaxID=91739 RepID=UPI001C2082CE|nr:streptococcal hemagglutinin-like [Aricia agestis]
MATERNVDVRTSASSFSDVTTQEPSENIKSTDKTTTDKISALNATEQTQTTSSTSTQRNLVPEATTEWPFSTTTMAITRNRDVTTSASSFSDVTTQEPSENIKSTDKTTTEKISEINATEQTQSPSSTSTQSNVGPEVSTELPFSTTTMATGRNVDVTASASSISDGKTQHASDNIESTDKTTTDKISQINATEQMQTATFTSKQSNLGPATSTELPFITTTLPIENNVDDTTSASTFSNGTTQHPSDNIESTDKTTTDKISEMNATEQMQTATSTSKRSYLGSEARSNHREDF